MFSGGQEERSGLKFFFYVLVTTNFSEVVCKVEYAFFQSSCSAILVNSCLVYVAFFLVLLHLSSVRITYAKARLQLFRILRHGSKS